jgi:uncharacterized membrane protein
MSSLIGTRCVHRVHRFCVSQLLYPLVLASLFAGAIFAGRVYLSHSSTYRFLVWNLVLAWIPYGCSLLIALVHARWPRRWWLLLLPGALWLLFLPNAPYIVTDLWHLDWLGERKPIPLWYDLGMLATFAWTGLFLAIASLNTMQSIVRDYCGRVVSWLFVLGAMGACGWGIYLGRFLNWNSWDVFLRPHRVLADIAARFAHPIQNSGAFGFTLLFAAFMLVCYLTFASVEHRQRHQLERE